MTSSMGLTDGNVKKATYEYNGLGHRMGQSIATGDNHPARTISYTLDLTRQYNNLLQKTTGMATVGNSTNQTYFWDGNVTGMEEEGRNHFYFQDDLGSPMRLADEAGRSEEIYGYDEFGNDIRTGQDIRTAHDIFKSPMQSFGFTGYQMDEAGGLYFAQARRYDAEAGRFTSEDFIKGHIAVPYTMNHYNYCWNRPMDLVDLNGMWPSLSDIGKGAQKLASSAADKVSKAADKVSDVAKDTAQGIKDTASNITHAAKNWANSDEGKIILTTAGYLGVGALAVATGGVAGVVLGGIAVGAAAGAVTGGVSNMMKGGTFANGYVGGAVNGAIVGEKVLHCRWNWVY